MPVRPTSLALVAACCLASAACIEPTRTVIPADSRDGTGPTDVVGSDGVDGLDDIEDPDGDDGIDPPDTTLPACAPALTLSPAEIWLGPGQEAVLTAAGGSDARTLTPSDATAIAVSTTGSVSPLGRLGTFAVNLTDPSCDGSAATLVHVVDRPSILPEMAAIPADGQVRFAVSGGSPDVILRLASPGPAESCDGCNVDDDTHRFYANGAREGSVGRVEAHDPRTGLNATAEVTVRESSRLDVGERVVLLAPGAAWTPPVTGGVGVPVVELEITGSFEWSGDTVLRKQGSEDGRLRVTDPYSDAVAQVDLVAVTPLTHAITGSSQGGLPSPILHTADLNGDGFMDLVVGQPEATGQRARSGTVLVFLGSASGLADAPVQRLEGAEYDGRFGAGVYTVDVDGDQVVDLLVGEPRADVGALRDAGRVLMYRGLGDGRFATETMAAWTSDQAAAQLGTRVAACDVDGDGLSDLIVTAPDAFDAASGRTLRGQGALFIYFGNASGWGPTPSVARWGLSPSVNDGPASPALAGTVRLGLSLAVGQLDGNQSCDIAVGAPDANTTTPVPAEGRLQVYLGRSRDLWLEGDATPDLFVTNAKGFARSLAIGDLDRDGRAELAIGHPGWYLDPSYQSSPERGGVFVVSGDAFASSSPQLAYASSVGIIYGEGNLDAFGTSVHIGDATGDALPDLVVGAWRAENEAGAANNGVVTVHAFLSGDLEASTISRRIEGTLDEHLGLAVAALAMPGDASTDIAVMAPYSNSNGLDAMSLYVDDRRGIAPRRRELALSNRPIPWRIGAGVASLPDIGGTGEPAFIVGAPDETVNTGSGRSHLRYAGGTHVYRTRDTDPPQRAQSIGLFGGQNENDRWGEAIATLSDFNGDGAPDLAVAARTGEWLGANAGGWTSGELCSEGRTSNAGAVGIFAVNTESVSGAAIGTRPYAFLFNDTANEGLTGLFAAGDVNGDGLSDLVATQSLAGNGAGMAQLWLGRRWSTTGSALAECGATFARRGNPGQRFGAQAVPLGDADGDGCDEMAVSAPGGATGAVMIVRGAGAGCASRDFGSVTLLPPAGTAGFGEGLASGDLVGSSAMDLVIGAPLAAGGGAVWIIDGNGLVDLLDRIDNGQLVGESFQINGLLDAFTTHVEGHAYGTAFGAPLAIIAGNGDVPAVLAVGAVADPMAASPDATTIRLLSIRAGVPVSAGVYVSGEGPDAEAGRLSFSGWTAEGGRGVLVGSAGSDVFAPDMGAAFPLFLHALDARLAEQDD